MKHTLFSISHRQLITLVMLLVMAAGIFAYLKIQTSLFPEITFPKIKLIAENGEEPAEKMLITVTKPMENAIKQVKDLQLIRSTTTRGSCEINAYFDWHSNIDQDLASLQGRINQIAGLPSTVNFTMEKMNPAILPVMSFTLESNDRDLIELKQMAINQVRPFLLQSAGASDVRVLGGRSKEYRVVLHPEQMIPLGITPQFIKNVFDNTGFVESNGLTPDYRRLYLTLTESLLHNKEDLENLVLRNDGKRILRLKDVADVEITSQDEFTVVNADGQDRVLVNVYRQPGANLIALSDSVLRRVDQLNASLPNDVRVKKIYNQAEFVNDGIGSVRDALFIGLFLALIVMLIFLRSFRSSAILLLNIPIVLSLTILIMYLMNYTLNIMTLGAITASIGLIIDDAVVVIEQIYRAREENPSSKVKMILEDAIHYLFPAMIGSSLSTVIIFVPFALLGGLAGAFFKVLAASMCIALVCSFFVSWLVIPVLYQFFYRDRETEQTTKTRDQSRLNWLARWFTKPIISVLIIVALLIASIITYLNLETGFLPDMDEGTIVLDYLSPPGTSLQETDAILKNVDKIVASVPEVKSFSRRTGLEMGFFVTEVNKGDYLIQLKKDRSRSVTEVMDDLRTKIEASEPALRIDFGQILSDMLGDLLGEASPIEINIFGDDQSELRQLTDQVTNIVDSVPGAADAFDGIIISGPSIVFAPKQEMLARHNLTPQYLDFQLNTMLQGEQVGSIPEHEQLVPVNMRYPPSVRENVQTLRNQFIQLPDSSLRPLSDFADVQLTGGEAEIQRENLQSMLAVTARLNQRDLGSVMRDIQQRISADVHVPQGFYIEYGGAYAQQQQSFRELLMILFLAIALVLCVQLMIFRSWRASLLILFVSVFGISGCLFGLYLTGTALNVGSFTGIIMIVGIIAENAVFTMHQFRKARITMDVRVSVNFAIGTRIRPKLMTAISAIIALMPLVLGFGTGAELHQPLAIAIIGGFITAMPLLLLVLPTGMLFVFKNRNVSDSGNFL